MADTEKSDHADVLNALVEMQGTMLYAARRSTLMIAERTIVSLEKELRELRKRLTRDEALKLATDCFEYGQRDYRGCQKETIMELKEKYK